MDIDPKIQETFDRLGITLPGVAGGMDKLSKATDKAVKSATMQALEQARAHQALIKSIEKDLRQRGIDQTDAKIMATLTAKKIKQETDQSEALAQRTALEEEATKKLQARFNKSVDGLNKLASGSLSVVSAFASSDKLFTSAIPTLDLMGTTIKSVVSGLAEMVSGVSAFGFSFGKASEGIAKVVGVGVDLTVQVAKMQLEMAEKYVDNYNQLSSVGATFGGQLGGLADKAKNSGMWLDQFAKFVKTNIVGLTEMGGTVDQSTTLIGKMSASATDHNKKLVILYGGYDKVSGALVGFGKQMASVGLSATQQQDYLVKNSGAYLTNLKALSEMTGQTVEQLQKEQEEANKDIAYRLKLRELGQLDAKDGGKRMQDTMNAELIIRKTYGQNSADLYKEKIALDGQVISQSGQMTAAYFVEQNKAIDQIIATKNLEGEARTKAIGGIVEGSKGAIEAQTKLLAGLVQLGQYAGDEVTKTITEGIKQQLDSEGVRTNLNSAVTAAWANSKTAMDAEAAAVVKLTNIVRTNHQELDTITKKSLKDTAEMATALHKVTTELIRLFGEAGQVSKAVTIFADMIADVAGKLRAYINSQTGTTSNTESKSKFNWGKVGTEALKYGGIGTVMGAGMGSIAGGVGAVPGAGIGFGVGAVTGGAVELAKQAWSAATGTDDKDKKETEKRESISKLLSFAGGVTGNRSNYDALDPGVRGSFEEMLAAYGKPVKLQSGFRTQAQQTALYKEWLAGGGGPGKPTVITPTFGSVTKPAADASFHSLGKALDIDSDSFKALDAAGLLKQFGFKTVDGDPGHIQKMAKGGITDGTSIAGEAGPEAVIPLPDGRTVPVKLDVGELISKMDQLIAVMMENRDFSEKIFQAAA